MLDLEYSEDNYALHQYYHWKEQEALVMEYYYEEYKEQQKDMKNLLSLSHTWP